MNIEKELFPQANKLRKEKGKDYILKSTIVDIELDPIEVEFQNDDCATLDVSDYTYISLSLNNLTILESLIWEAKQKYNQHIEKEKDEK